MYNLTTEEKIDYIYKTLKKQESRLFWSAIFKWWFRLFVIIYILYAYYFILPWLIADIKENLKPKINTESINLDSIKNLFNK